MILYVYAFYFSMQMNGQYIEWQQLWKIYRKVSTMSIQSKGITLAPKLKLEHLKLTSYESRRAQVRNLFNALLHFVLTKVLSKTVCLFQGLKHRDLSEYLINYLSALM